MSEGEEEFTFRLNLYNHRHRSRKNTRCTVFLCASSADFVRASKELGSKVIFESAGGRVGKM